MNKDHSHSWVRISHGLNKLVTNLNNNEQDDIPEVQPRRICSSKIGCDVILQADQRPKQNHKGVDSASSSTRTFPTGKRTWTDVEPGRKITLRL